MRKSIKLLLASTLVTLGLFSYSAINDTHTSVMPTEITTHAMAVNYNRAAEPRVSRNINRLAQQRRKYHHPSISWNFRDIGGYNTYNNRYHVKTGKLYLSSYIGNISKRGVNQLNRLHVHTDIDMRNYQDTPTSIVKHPQPGEMELSPNKPHLHLRYLNYPVSDSREEAHNWATVPSSFQNNYYYEINHFRNQYLLNPVAKRAYHNSFIAIMKYTNHRNAIMFNCNSGRDRSACLGALILGLLQVNQHTVENNYLLTNRYGKQTPYTNQVKRIQTFYKTIRKHYHSIYDYATSRNGLNLSRRFINRFKHRFLVRN